MTDPKNELPVRPVSLLEECEAAAHNAKMVMTSLGELSGFDLAVFKQLQALLDRLRPICEDRRSGRTKPVERWIEVTPGGYDFTYRLQPGQEPEMRAAGSALTKVTIYARVPDKQKVHTEEGEP